MSLTLLSLDHQITGITAVLKFGMQGSACTTDLGTAISVSDHYILLMLWPPANTQVPLYPGSGQCARNQCCSPVGACRGSMLSATEEMHPGQKSEIGKSRGKDPYVQSLSNNAATSPVPTVRKL